MPPNVDPIFSRIGKMAWAVLTTANTAKDGTGTVATVFTADATNGGRIEKVVCFPAGTNVATALRIFINNGSTNATPANNTLYAEVTMPATTVSEVAAQAVQEVLLELALPAGYKVNITIGTTVAAGIAVTGVGGDY